MGIDKESLNVISHMNNHLVLEDVANNVNAKAMISFPSNATAASVECYMFWHKAHIFDLSLPVHIINSFLYHEA